MDIDEMRRLAGANSRKYMSKERATEIGRNAGKASGSARRALSKKKQPKKSS